MLYCHRTLAAVVARQVNGNIRSIAPDAPSGLNGADRVAGGENDGSPAVTA